MRKGLFARLALTGIRKNGKIYYPYMLTAVVTTAMLYIMASLKKNPELEKEDKKPLSGIAERPYCRGRAYQADRYGKRGAQKEASSGENEE